ncbi:alpha/beta hydrolase [Novosphingobium lubricantis]|uniref:alpha/beta hydrolase n=1 Tax=Novosphingobium sp. CCH12-A3 TaxID=1768752 RepID=UPI000781C14B|nr:alpha/beta hydrolase [Novosphingobium sp. CCH12-A3]
MLNDFTPFHKFVDVRGVRLHCVEMGEGPLVILVHGFPESWYSWRHQLAAIARQGYRVVALDQRGYGSSSKFAWTDSYRIGCMVDDLVGLIAALGEKTAVLVGHDWGSVVAWTTAWLHPEVVAGVVGIAVPFSGRGQVALPGNPFGERPPSEIDRIISGPDKDFYQVRFAEMTDIIDEIEADVRGWVGGITWSVSGDALSAAGYSPDGHDPVEFIRASPMCLTPGTTMRAQFAMPEIWPDWFTEADLDVFVDTLQMSGFSGPLSYYHNMENNWRDLAEFAGRSVTSPSLFIGGEFDVCTHWGADAIAQADQHMSNWMGSRIVSGAGHWIQQEKPGEVNSILLEFLHSVRGLPQ